MADAWRAGESYPMGQEDRYSQFREGAVSRGDLELRRLEDLHDWKMAEGEPDIRGWNIIGRDDQNIGKVDTLIASPQTRLVYFIVAQVGGVLGLGGKHVLVPLDEIHIDRSNQQVHLDATRDDLENAVEWRHDTGIDWGGAYRYWEQRTRMGVVGGERELAGMRGGEARTESRVPLREEELVAQREHRTGEVIVGKHVETEQRTVETPVTHTEVEIERRAVTGAAQQNAQGEFGQPGEVRIPVVEEEMHVEKRPVVKEEIVVRQHPVTETERATETVRREVPDVRSEGDLDVETKGNVDVNQRGMKGGMARKRKKATDTDLGPSTDINRGDIDVE